MDREKMHFSYEGDPPIKPANMKRKEYPNKHLEVDKGESLRKRQIQVPSKINSKRYAKGIIHRYATKWNKSSVKKTNNIRRMMLKYLRRAIRNPTGTLKNIRFIRRKGKILKVFRSNSAQILAENRKCVSEMDKCKDIFEEDFWLEIISQNKKEDFEDVMSRVTDIRKSEGKMLSELETQSEDSTSHDAPLPSTQSASTSSTQDDDASETQAPVDILGKEVWKQFIGFMKSKETLDRTNTDINEENIKPSPKSEICSVEDPSENAAESVNQDLEDSEKPAEFACQDSKDPTKLKSESTSKDLKVIARTKSEMTQNSGKVICKVSESNVDNCKTGSKFTRNIPIRQQIVCNEKSEKLQGWIFQNIKDRKILMKLLIMEGKYSNDMETEMICIERANDLQGEIDQFYDILDDTKKMENISKSFKRHPKPAKKRENYLKLSAERIQSLTSLFLYLYKFSRSLSEEERVFQRINPRKLMAAYDEYLASKGKLDKERNRSEFIAKSVVYDFHQSFEMSNAKCKISYAESISLEGYKNYINELKIATNENFNSLYALLPPATSVILPLIGYLGQCRSQCHEIFSFLKKERPQVFLKKI